ncbi:MAG TPA: CocE/NonD family hydrolase [Chloroflexota bacterium]|nr:CocE/NonD family hydrolase [Chloroflexota bacterium]
MPSQPEHGLVIAKDLMVPMRDGVRLATDVYRPARGGEPLPGPFPAILGRTSYDKSSPQMWVEPVGEFFARRGYVVVLQDLRGRHRSEGTGQYFHTANPNEGPDGYDTVEWIAGQPWSNGRVGTVGSSHGAIVQQVMALHRPPHLSAIWPDVGPTNIHAHEAREGGAMALHMFGALFLHAHDAQEIRDDPEAKRAIERAMERMRELVFETPFRPGQTPLRVVPNLEKILFDYYHRGAYDEFWAQECCDQTRRFDRHADVPGTYSGGWFDPFSAATTGYYAAMAARKGTPQRLIMGPWAHPTMRGPGSTWTGDVDFGPDAGWGDAVYNAERLRWFDRWLKGELNGVEHDPPVRIFVMGGGDGRRTAEGKLSHGGRWRAEREWPLARTRHTPYYLRAGGLLSPEPDPDPRAGTPARNGSGRPASFTFDPSHPVPTVGGAVTGFYELLPLPEGLHPAFASPRARMRSIVLEGPTHQREAPGVVGARPPYPLLAERPDVLVFQTPPLEHEVEVTGPIAVELWVSSSAPDTDFTAKLVDVYPPNADFPDGYDMGLVDSIIRTRYRGGWEHEELMTPGEVYVVRIALPPTSNLFRAGHRIRLDVSSSNFPRFDVNPNTGEPVGRHTRLVSAGNTVYCDRSRPSRVVLPIIP